MAEKKTATKTARTTARSGKTSAGLSDFERQAVKDRARELKAEARRGADRAEGDRAIREKIAEMPQPDRSMAERVDAIVKAAAPDLMPKTWYGMPAYARDGKVVCFFQSGAKYESRYCTLGFTDQANLDQGSMWPASFALKSLTAAEVKKIAALVKKAVR
jgi:uncharacterized protein YdhG (YjbR/CyaY superfamily)